MTKPIVRKLRCAVYTRKSSEEGLEQEFNSLHAQREACEAYIASQRHEGWVAGKARYDDGGISGATLERPALQRLLADIEAGLYDGAEVRCWLVNWADVNLRALQFRGQIGEIRRDGGAFEAELLGLTDLLNQPMGRVYQAPCAAVLGDASCGKDISEEGYQAEVEVLSVEGNILTFASMPGYEVQWFQRGVLEVLSGSGAGQSVPIKRDWETQNGREITLWTAMGAPVSAGDTVRLTAGCDKRMETCRNKFNNLINFQGFPDIPGNDWTVAFPASETATGGSRR